MGCFKGGLGQFWGGWRYFGERWGIFRGGLGHLGRVGGIWGGLGGSLRGLGHNGHLEAF